MDEEMESENERGIGVPLETQNQIMQGQMQNDLGMQQMEPDLEGAKGRDSTAAPEINIKKAKI